MTAQALDLFTAEPPAHRKPRPRTFATALAAWDDAEAAVHADPCDATLQTLCTLLDVMDGDLVRRWGTAGHDDRRAALSRCRAAAHAANAAVTAAGLTAAQERAAKAVAGKRAKAEAGGS